ncbi:MAG TPA: tyrosine-type recombinase/integrase [Jiangellaceae bacterium]
MSVSKTENGRFRAKLKSGRVDVASKVFDTRREANAWLDRERAALAGGVDPRAGRERVRDALVRWLEVRRTTVARKTYKADADLHRLMPTAMQALQLSAVSGREVSRSFVTLLSGGLSETSVVRYRASLSAFFAWCVQEKLIVANPVTGTAVPKSSDETTEMLPFTEDELEAAYLQWRKADPHLADVLLVLGWTGLRWAEARALTVGDVMRVPSPRLQVRRSAPEGVATKATKGRRSRRVPLADRVLPLVERMASGKGPTDLLLTTSRGARLHRSAVLRSVKWEPRNLPRSTKPDPDSGTGAGRRIHDLRHTAACLWLTRRVDVGTVQAWMGHESIATTNRYLHYLGTDADNAGLARLNAERGGHQGGTAQARE